MADMAHAASADMRLENRIALVTGGRRIGQVVAEELARAGADVALSLSVVAAGGRGDGHARARAGPAGDRAAGRREPAGRLCSPGQGIEQQLGGLDIVVNMASTYVSRPLAEIDERAWRADIDNNLSSAFHVTHAVLPLLRRRSPAHVVNFTDWLPASGRPRYTGFVAYYVAKAGVKALTEALALELAKDGILVNAIAPGPIVPPPDMR